MAQHGADSAPRECEDTRMFDTLSRIQDERPLRLHEAAAIANVHRDTIQRWIDTGRLAGMRMPGTRERRTTLAALRAYLESAS